MKNPYKSIATCLSLALAITLLLAGSALALLPNHDYSVQMSSLSESNQLTMIEEVSTTTDANGKLSFQFSNVPDSSIVPFLLVEIIDMASGQSEVVRQHLIPAPAAGQDLQMGMNKTTHRQTQASLRAFSTAGSVEPLRAMFPLTMISSGALSDDDADNLGMMTDEASSAFESYLIQAGVDDAQISNFSSGLVDAMRDLAANCLLAVDETDPTAATNLRGRANGLFMQAMVDAAAAAGIDAELIPAAFDHARLEMENSQGAMRLSASGLAIFDGSYMTSRQQMGIQSQMQQYADAMMMFNLDTTQMQAFIDAKTQMDDAMLRARQDYQQLFSDPSTLPDQTMIDQAKTDFSVAIQMATDNFMLATEASDLQIDAMLAQMAVNMDSGMMGGGMMTGNGLASMGFGQVQMLPGGTQQNWSIMMVAGNNLANSMVTLDYVPRTSALMLELEQRQTTPDLPFVPDWSALPDDANRSLLQLQTDLMLTAMIEHQYQENLDGMMDSLNQAQLNIQDMTNRQNIRQGIQGLTNPQTDKLLAAMSPIHPN